MQTLSLSEPQVAVGDQGRRLHALQRNFASGILSRVGAADGLRFAGPRPGPSARIQGAIVVVLQAQHGRLPAAPTWGNTSLHDAERRDPEIAELLEKLLAADERCLDGRDWPSGELEIEAWCQRIAGLPRLHERPEDEEAFDSALRAAREEQVSVSAARDRRVAQLFE